MINPPSLKVYKRKKKQKKQITKNKTKTKIKLKEDFHSQKIQEIYLVLNNTSQLQ